MHEAAYHHYALNYLLLTALTLVLFAVLVILAKVDGDRGRRRTAEVRASAPDSRPTPERSRSAASR